MESSKPEYSLSKLLGMGSNVKVYHLPNHAKFDMKHNPDGSRTYNPLSLSNLCANLAVANTDPKDVQRYLICNDWLIIVVCHCLHCYLIYYCTSYEPPVLKSNILHDLCYRFIGQNRPQFRAIEPENPDEVKDLVQRLEKFQTPNPDDAEYVRLELAK